MRSSRILLLSGCLLFCAAAPASAESVAYAESVTSKEYQLKAAFLYNFAKFVEWPSEPAQTIDDNFLIGIYGGDPFGGEIDGLLRGKTVSEKPIEIVRFRTLDEVRPCHILFIHSSQSRALDKILEKLEGRSVLTVSENSFFTESGGMISFVMEDNKVRFEINKQATDKAGLRLSSQLLKLAKTVIS